MAETFKKLVSYSTSGSSSTSITLSSIPQTHDDLFIVFNGTGTTGGGAVNVRFNGDTGSNYQVNYMWNNASSSTAASASSTFAGAARIFQVSAGVNSGGWMYLPNYTSSLYKVFNSRSFHNNINISYTNSWRNTSAISSMTLSLESSSAFNTDFRTDVYGITKA